MRATSWPAAAYRSVRPSSTSSVGGSTTRRAPPLALARRRRRRGVRGGGGEHDGCAPSLSVAVVDGRPAARLRRRPGRPAHDVSFTVFGPDYGPRRARTRIVGFADVTSLFPEFAAVPGARARLRQAVRCTGVPTALRAGGRGRRGVGVRGRGAPAAVEHPVTPHPRRAQRAEPGVPRRVAADAVGPRRPRPPRVRVPHAGLSPQEPGGARRRRAGPPRGTDGTSGSPSPSPTTSGSAWTRPPGR